MLQQNLQIILTFLAVLLGLYLAFFKSYFQERGKIVATKKDIELITEKVEIVKSEIGLLTHRKISLATEKQNALVDFNSTYSAWLNFIMHASLKSEIKTADNHISDVNGKIDALFYDFIISEARVDLFFNSDIELIASKENLKLKTIELSHLLGQYLIEVGVQSRIIALCDNLLDSDYRVQELAKHNELLLAKIKECQEQKLEKYRDILPSKLKLVELVAKRVSDFNTG